jgi:hypothetical protein
MSPQDEAMQPVNAKDDTKPLPSDALIVVPVRDLVLFPEMVFPRAGDRGALSRAEAQIRDTLELLPHRRADVENRRRFDAASYLASASILEACCASRCARSRRKLGDRTTKSSLDARQPRSSELPQGDRRRRHADPKKPTRSTPAQGAQAAAAHARGVGRARHGAHLSRLDGRAALGRPPPEPIDIAEARAVLDADHFGLDKIKRRILEYLAVRKLAPEGKSPILCFVGPPGVGKTSLGQSIARATGRKFAARERWAACTTRPRSAAIAAPTSARCRATSCRRSARRGVARRGDHARRDRQARRRHARRSVGGAARGARPGAERQVPRQLPRRAVRPVAGAVHRHRKQLDTIPGPLRDRMEIIQLPGYTASEKLEIARRYLVRSASSRPTASSPSR